MDPRHPNIAFAANTVALIAFVALLFSLFLPIGTPRGWGNIETGLLAMVPLSLALSWWARREHDVPVVHEHGSSAAQYEAMEDLPTMVSLDAAQDSVNPNTAAVIESIIGSQATQDESAVDNAISALSKGQIGQSSALLFQTMTLTMPKSMLTSSTQGDFKLMELNLFPYQRCLLWNFQMCR